LGSFEPLFAGSGFAGAAAFEGAAAFAGSAVSGCAFAVDSSAVVMFRLLLDTRLERAGW
jgi:hypothetical protein